MMYVDDDARARNSLIELRAVLLPATLHQPTAAAVAINAAERSFRRGDDGGVALQSFFKRICE
jgi:hypothetical protein